MLTRIKKFPMFSHQIPRHFLQIPCILRDITCKKHREFYVELRRFEINF
jgi:hypothetical protein